MKIKASRRWLRAHGLLPKHTVIIPPLPAGIVMPKLKKGYCWAAKIDIGSFRSGGVSA